MTHTHGHLYSQFKWVFTITLTLFLTLSLSYSRASAPAPEKPKKTYKKPPRDIKATLESPIALSTLWNYTDKGPSTWPTLCQKGSYQSPINLTWQAPRSGGKITFDYRENKLNIQNTGNTLLVEIEPNQTIRIRNRVYTLQHIEFHSPSEHTLSKKRFPMEIYFVHQNEDKDFAYLSVFVKEGKSNALIEKFWNLTPKVGLKRTHSEHKFNPLDLIPNQLTYYHYQGSLTTPPCTQGVNWNVLNNPIELSKAQISRFKKLYPNNARTIQKNNSREVINY